jgi:two-component system, NarL family, sensor histidine kinase DevS
MAGRDQRDVLFEAGLALSSELSLPVLLHTIVELGMELTGARYGALGVLGPGERIIEFVTVGVTPEERRAIGHPPTGRGVLGALIKDGRPLRLASIADDPRSVGFPPNHPPMRTFIGAPVMARGEVFGNIYLTEKQGGSPFTEEDQTSLVILAAQAGIAVANARLYEQSESRGRWLTALGEVTTAILAGAEVREALGLVVARSRELAGAAMAWVVLPDEEEEGSLVVGAADGTGTEGLEGTTVPLEGSISGSVISLGKPVVVENASEDERAFKGLIEVTRMGPTMFIPLIVRDRAFGTLSVTNPIGAQPFTEAQVDLVEAFAAQASVAVEFGEAQRQLQRLTLMEDRERIAKELHDGVIQSLFAVGMGLQGTAMLAADEDIARRIEGGVEELDRVIKDLRSYIFGLRPDILAGGRLDDALRQLGAEFAERTGVVTVAEVDPRAAAALAGQATDVVQLAREALSNVGRHAGATTVRVSLAMESDGPVLMVDDDGRGFDVSSPPAGEGLRNMRQRAEGMGASLDLTSIPGEGTTLRIAFRS